MRTEKSLKNSIVAIITNTLTIIIGFVAQSFFIQYLGKSYLGINGLFNNLISMIAIAELGIGPAIIFHLYRPIAKKEIEKIKSLMLFYKKCYRIIASITFLLGILVIPFLPRIVGEVAITESIYIIYAMFLIDAVISYLLSYKRSILYANQENYLVNLVHIGYLIFTNLFMIMALMYTKNYYLYLGIKIIMRFLENYMIALLADRKYRFLKESAKELDKETYQDIIKRVKAMITHKVGSYIVFSSDNIIISMFLKNGIDYVGLYANYSMIITSVKTLFGQLISSITASIGNLLVTDKNKSYDIFQKILYINFILATFGTTGILVLMNDFITLWIGEEFLLSNVVLITLAIHYFLTAMRDSYSTFMTAAGICYENRFVPIYECIVNLIFSIILVKFIGLPGVFIGTIISNMVLFLYSHPLFLYKPIFQKNYGRYFLDLSKYMIGGFMIIALTYGLSQYIHLEHLYLNLIVKFALCLILPNLIIIVTTCKTKEFQYFKKVIIRLKNKLKPTNE